MMLPDVLVKTCVLEHAPPLIPVFTSLDRNSASNPCPEVEESAVRRMSIDPEVAVIDAGTELPLKDPSSGEVLWLVPSYT